MSAETRSAVAAAAHALLAELIRLGAAGGPPDTVTVTGDGWTVTVRASACADPAERLTPCERDILALVAGRQRRLTTPEILAGLEDEGLQHGESTVKHALAELVRRGRLVNRKSPRGYGLAG